MFDKVEVNGAGAHPLYRWLTRAAPGLLGTERIKWNFTKFLVGRDGRVVKRYAPLDKPEAIASDIEKLLEVLQALVFIVRDLDPQIVRSVIDESLKQSA